MYSALLTKITHNSNKSHRSWTIRHTKLAGTCYIRSLGYPRLTAAHAQFLACGKLEKLSVKTRLEEKAAEEAIRQSWQAYSSKFHSPLFQRSLELENRCTIEAQRSRGDKKASNFVVDSVSRWITTQLSFRIVSHSPFANVENYSHAFFEKLLRNYWRLDRRLVRVSKDFTNEIFFVF